MLPWNNAPQRCPKRCSRRWWKWYLEMCAVSIQCHCLALDKCTYLVLACKCPLSTTKQWWFRPMWPKQRRCIAANTIWRTCAIRPSDRANWQPTQAMRHQCSTLGWWTNLPAETLERQRQLRPASTTWWSGSTCRQSAWRAVIDVYRVIQVDLICPAKLPALYVNSDRDPQHSQM